MESRDVSLTHSQKNAPNDVYEKRKKPIDKAKLLFIIAFLCVPTINFIVFFIYPNIDAFFMSFQKPIYSLTGVTYDWTTEQFEKVFTSFFADPNGLLRLAFKNTILHYVTGTFITFPLSIVMTYFIYKQIAGYRVFRFIFYLPSIITSAAIVMLFKYSLQTGGPVSNICKMMDWEYTYPMTDPNRANPTILIYSILFGFGGNLVVYGGAMNAINAEMLEAGELDGCNWFQELIYLVVPSIWPTMSTSLILGLAGILGSSGPVLAFTKGSYNTTTLSFELYRLVGGINCTQDLHYASAVGMSMTVIVFPLVLFIRWWIYGRKEKE